MEVRNELGARKPWTPYLIRKGESPWHDVTLGPKLQCSKSDLLVDTVSISWNISSLFARKVTTS